MSAVKNVSKGTKLYNLKYLIQSYLFAMDLISSDPSGPDPNPNLYGSNVLKISWTFLAILVEFPVIILTTILRRTFVHTELSLRADIYRSIPRK